METPRTFLDRLGECDTEYHALVKQVWDMAQAPGALDLRTKTLMVLLIDSMKGQKEATPRIAAKARELGASDDEIREVIRLAFLAGGVSGLAAGVMALVDD